MKIIFATITTILIVVISGVLFACRVRSIQEETILLEHYRTVYVRLQTAEKELDEAKKVWEKIPRRYRQKIISNKEKEKKK